MSVLSLIRRDKAVPTRCADEALAVMSTVRSVA